MLLSKKMMVITTLIALVVVSIAASHPPADPKHKNLKVLPKDISHEDLDKIMDEFKVALGVKCNFCHAEQKDNPRKLDFASDDKPEKNIARDMMRMTARINKKFFHYKKSTENPVAPVQCLTCHHGAPHPGEEHK
jgi:Photosynthetic reaction centre cytochrome C subunit